MPSLGSPAAIMRSRVLRSLAAALAVGALVGLVVAGEITFGGTVAVLATGVALGLLGALVYLALRSWLPARGGYRSVVFALIVLGFGLFVTIDGNQEDFVFLNTAVSIGSFAAVLLLYALVVPPLIDRFAPRTDGQSRWGHGVVVGVLAFSLVVGALAVKHAVEYADGSRLPD